MKTIKWGMIGVGDVTEVKSGPGLYKTPHSELLAVTSRTRRKAADYARRHGVPKVYADATALLEDPEISYILRLRPAPTKIMHYRSCRQVSRYMLKNQWPCH